MGKIHNESEFQAMARVFEVNGDSLAGSYGTLQNEVEAQKHN